MTLDQMISELKLNIDNKYGQSPPDWVCMSEQLAKEILEELCRLRGLEK